MEAPSAGKLEVLGDFSARGANLCFHGVKIGGVEHDQWPAIRHDLAQRDRE